MAHTKSQRDMMRLCGAKKKNGETCRALAGQGTDHFGYGHCRFHLGNAPAHKKHAAKLEAQARLREHEVEFGESLDVDPATALLGVLHLSAGHLNWVRAELAEIEDKAGAQGQVYMRIFDEERDRIARISKAALDAGVAERQVRLAEAYGEQMAHLLREVFYDKDLSLTARQQGMLDTVLRRHLLALPTGDRAQ